jgi:hypothetical protein
MNVVEEIAQKALEIKEGEPLEETLSRALDAAESEGMDRISAQTLLFGFLAIDKWFCEMKNYLEYFQEGAEFRRLRDGRVTSAFHGYSEKRNQLNRFSKERHEMLLLLGFMDQCGSSTVSKKYIFPLAPAIAQILGLRRDDEDEDDEDEIDEQIRIYKNLNKRWNALAKKHQDPSELIRDGRQMFRQINSTLYRES